MAENELEPPALGISWDGTGYGLDGIVWGGEFFLVTDAACERIAHFRPFRLPGGDQAIKEPRRTALGLLFAGFGEAAFEMGDLPPICASSKVELASFRTMLLRELNSPLTSSVGRLFDAIASLTGLRQRVRFEGQAAMELEFAVDESDASQPYPLPLLETLSSAERPAGAHPSPTLQNQSLAADPALLTPRSSLVLDWFALLQAVLADLRQKVPRGIVAARFHNALVEGMVSIAKRMGQERVVLSGGCFQNRYLTERAIHRLQQEGFRPYWHQRVPPNDGGISLGQIVAALRQNV